MRDSKRDTMRILCFDDPARFWQRAAPFLMAQEAKNNLPIGIVLQAIEKPSCYGAGLFLALVEEDGKAAGTALLTPRFPVVLTHCPRAAIPLVIDEMAQRYLPIKGVVGPPSTAALFAETYTRGQPGTEAKRDKEMRIYTLEQAVMPTNDVAGRPILGRMDQLARATDYLEGFFELSNHQKVFDTETVVRSAILEGRLYFWETSEPVSMAVWVRQTPHAKAVGYVYTPPPHQGNGYATHLVARMSNEALASGLSSIVLYADLDNPISNHIYQKIGYHPVDEAWQIVISPVGRRPSVLRGKKG